jgi:hypothetical protein
MPKKIYNEHAVRARAAEEPIVMGTGKHSQRERRVRERDKKGQAIAAKPYEFPSQPERAATKSA